MIFDIIDSDKAYMLRQKYHHVFADTASPNYIDRIATIKQYPDGACYDGYLWECLKDNENYQKECSMETAMEYLKEKDKVCVMWDLFSDKRISINRVFVSDYPRDIVISVAGAEMCRRIDYEWNADWNEDGLLLPEDIYCFDESMSWSVIFTHEGWDSYSNPELGEDEYIRICFMCMISNS